MTQDTQWHLDKSVPISIIIFLMAQMVGGVWFMSNLNAQVGQIARANELQDQRIESVEKAAQAQAIAGATVANQISNIETVLDLVRQDQRSQIDLLRQVLERKP